MGDAESIPFSDGKFDIVTNRHVFWTLTQPKVALQEWQRVLKLGGRSNIGY